MSGMARTDAIRISGARDRGGQQLAVSWHFTTAVGRRRIALRVQAARLRSWCLAVGMWSSSWPGRSKPAESRGALLEGILA